MKLCVIFILFIWTAKASPESLPKRLNLKSIPVVDALILRLEGEEWADDEACLEATLRILNGVKNDTLWATWVWDSMQFPLGAFYGSSMTFGNYDQCLSSPWSSDHELSTQYCLVEVKIQKPMETREYGPFDSADKYLNTLSSSDRIFNHLGFGVCMPSVCSLSSVAKFSRHMLQLTHIPDGEPMVVDPRDCQTAEQEPYPGKFYAFLSVFGVLLMFVLVSTIYSYINNNEGSSRIDSIAKSISMIHNWKYLFKVNRSDVRVLHGMRFISAVLVVGLHQGMFSIVSPNMYINSLDLDKMFKSALGQGFTQVNLVVDTFFSMSGLLLMKGIMSGRQRNLLVVLLKRYFRLVGPYAAVTFYIMCVAPHTASGPIWPRVNAMEGDVCEKHWWKNFFMISNDLKTMCFGVAWYVTCDFHLAILTVILYWIYRRNRRNGVVAFVVVSCALTLQLAVMAYRKRMPLVIFNNIHVLAYIRDYEFINDFYIKWHDRAGTYLVGVTMGWLMAIYKPPQYRNVISKTKSFIMALVSLYVMLKVITINNWFGDAGRVEVAVAVATNRAVWAIAICSLIGACEYGSVPFISDFLGSAVFVPLSKLSYGIYMTHFFLLQINLHAVRSPLKFDPFYLVICVLGTTVLACFVSLALYLVVEAPCKNISNLYLSERDDGAGLCSISPVNGTNHQNGNTKLKAS